MELNIEKHYVHEEVFKVFKVLNSLVKFFFTPRVLSKPACAVHVSKIFVTGWTVSRPFWDPKPSVN